MTGTAVGAIGSIRQVRVDERGRIEPCAARWSLDWWIGADDRWHDPARETAVRQALVDAAPVVRTAMRVPGGDAVQHVYAAGGPDIIVLDVENQSPGPFVLALVVRAAERVAVDGAHIVVDGDTSLVTTRAPSRWATSEDTTTYETVTAGRAHDEPFVPIRDRRRRLEAAFLYPVAHRSALRVAVVPGASPADAARPDRLPGPADAARGWAAHLGRGVRVDLPDAALTSAVRSALAATLLASVRRPVAPETVAALEDWGFDAEAAAAWASLGWRDRRAASRRPGPVVRWPDVAASGTDAALLVGLRSLLAHDGDDGTLTLLTDLPPAWRGHGIEVHGVPTRAGSLSYAVRWHGPRPALLWDAPPGVRVRAPGLDPGWTSPDARGEALLSGAVP